MDGGFWGTLGTCFAGALGITLGVAAGGAAAYGITEGAAGVAHRTSDALANRREQRETPKQKEKEAA